MKTLTNQTCLKCGWVAFGVPRDWAENEVKCFNKYFETLTQADKDAFGGKPSTIAAYERCFRCGGPYTNFRNSKDGDAPNGVTMQPIIYEVL